MSQIPEDMFDVRKIERFLHEGLLTQDQVDAWLAGLEDCSANQETSSVQMIAHERASRVHFVDDGHRGEEDES
jgi:hypothetical protein